MRDLGRYFSTQGVADVIVVAMMRGWCLKSWWGAWAAVGGGAVFLILQ